MQKRNLKRKIESSANGFRFKNIGRALLIYPDSLTVDALVEKYSQIKTELKTMKSSSHEEKTAIQAGQIIRKQIKNMTDNLNWPPCYNDLTTENIDLGNFVSTFLNVILSGKIGDPETSRMHRIKLSLGQDMIYNVSNGRIRTPEKHFVSL